LEVAMTETRVVFMHRPEVEHFVLISHLWKREIPLRPIIFLWVELPSAGECRGSTENFSSSLSLQNNFLSSPAEPSVGRGYVLVFCRTAALGMSACPCHRPVLVVGVACVFSGDCHPQLHNWVLPPQDVCSRSFLFACFCFFHTGDHACQANTQLLSYSPSPTPQQ
jgi:hypothetical protein